MILLKPGVTVFHFLTYHSLQNIEKASSFTTITETTVTKKASHVTPREIKGVPIDSQTAAGTRRIVKKTVSCHLHSQVLKDIKWILSEHYGIEWVDDYDADLIITDQPGHDNAIIVTKEDTLIKQLGAILDQVVK